VTYITAHINDSVSIDAHSASIAIAEDYEAAAVAFNEFAGVMGPETLQKTAARFVEEFEVAAISQFLSALLEALDDENHRQEE
jgi:hypothetical protein